MTMPGSAVSGTRFPGIPNGLHGSVIGLGQYLSADQTGLVQLMQTRPSRDLQGAPQASGAVSHSSLRALRCRFREQAGAWRQNICGG